MSKEALFDRTAFVRGAQPAAMPHVDIAEAEAPTEFRPGLRSLELHPIVFAVMIGALGWFMASCVVAFAAGFGTLVLIVKDYFL